MVIIGNRFAEIKKLYEQYKKDAAAWEGEACDFEVYFTEWGPDAMKDLIEELTTLEETLCIVAGKAGRFEGLYETQKEAAEKIGENLKTIQREMIELQSFASSLVKNATSSLTILQESGTNLVTATVEVIKLTDENNRMKNDLCTLFNWVGTHCGPQGRRCSDRGDDRDDYCGYCCVCQDIEKILDVTS